MFRIQRLRLELLRLFVVGFVCFMVLKPNCDLRTYLGSPHKASLGTEGSGGSYMGVCQNKGDFVGHPI